MDEPKNEGKKPKNKTMLKPNHTTISNLKQQIAITRQRLMHLWDIRSFTDPEVLAASIELDSLMNAYQKIKSQTKS